MIVSLGLTVYSKFRFSWKICCFSISLFPYHWRFNRLTCEWYAENDKTWTERTKTQIISRCRSSSKLFTTMIRTFVEMTEKSQNVSKISKRPYKYTKISAFSLEAFHSNDLNFSWTNSLMIEKSQNVFEISSIRRYQLSQTFRTFVKLIC